MPTMNIRKITSLSFVSLSPSKVLQYRFYGIIKILFEKRFF